MTIQYMRKMMWAGAVAGLLLCGPDRAYAANPSVDSGRRQVAALRADLEICDENIRKLAAAVETLRQENADLRREVRRLRRDVERLGTVAEQARKAAERERRRREQAIERVLNTVSREVGAALQDLPAGGGSTGTGRMQGEYTVVRGDTLSTIAEAFGVSVDRLKRANNLKNDMIREGQTLVIPER